MKFRYESNFPNISVSEYEHLYFDDAFNEEICRAIHVERKVLKFEKSEQRIIRHVHCIPMGRELPAPVAKALGGGRIEYVEQIDYDIAKKTSHWVSVSSLLPDRIKIMGTMSIIKKGDGCMRTTEGDVSVSVFGIGSMIEKVIVADVEKSYATADAFTNEYWKKNN